MNRIVIARGCSTKGIGNCCSVTINVLFYNARWINFGYLHFLLQCWEFWLSCFMSSQEEKNILKSKGKKWNSWKPNDGFLGKSSMDLLGFGFLQYFILIFEHIYVLFLMNNGAFSNQSLHLIFSWLEKTGKWEVIFYSSYYLKVNFASKLIQNRSTHATLHWSLPWSYRI